MTWPFHVLFFGKQQVAGFLKNDCSEINPVFLRKGAIALTSSGYLSFFVYLFIKLGVWAMPGKNKKWINSLLQYFCFESRIFSTSTTNWGFSCIFCIFGNRKDYFLFLLVFFSRFISTILNKFNFEFEHYFHSEKQ